MSVQKLIPLMIVIAIMVLGAAFMPLILGSVDAGKSTNLSQEYKDQLNGTNNVNILTISTTKFVAPILGVIAIVMAISMFAKKRRF